MGGRRTRKTAVTSRDQRTYAQQEKRLESLGRAIHREQRAAKKTAKRKPGGNG